MKTATTKVVPLLPRQANVVIVGAGPAGLGMARLLHDLAIPDVLVIEREAIGASFRRWPKAMRFISPSFPGNTFGLTDLNAFSYDSSPGYSLRQEHPSGDDYATYLEGAARAFNIGVKVGVDVHGLDPVDDQILLRTNRGNIRARFVIWAAGQFQYPNLHPFDGAELGVHSSQIAHWSGHPGVEAIVIGGYESGIDAAIGLAKAGKRVTVLSQRPRWQDNSVDPSVSLSPYTLGRLEEAIRTLPIELVGNAHILGLEAFGNGTRVLAADGRSWGLAGAPVLATGFGGSTQLIQEWFDFDAAGYPMLTPHDESTALPGLFLVGPEVRHRGHMFCYIYKFRQRFAVVGRAIAGRLGTDSAALEIYRENMMYRDDLSCCDVDNCVC